MRVGVDRRCEDGINRQDQPDCSRRHRPACRRSAFVELLWSDGWRWRPSRRSGSVHPGSGAGPGRGACDGPGGGSGAVEPVTEARVAEEPVRDGGKKAAVAAMPVAAPPPALSEPVEVAVAAVPAVAAASAAATQAPVASPRPELPPVSAPAALDPVPAQDLLIAKASSTRFAPDVAALATAGLSVGVPIQGDENSLNVLQPCDTPASACGAGADPGQVVGGVNDWTGFVIPGF